MSRHPVLVLFRNDLRVADNGALAAAAATGRPVIAAFIDDPGGDGARPVGSAARWWRNRSLHALRDHLDDIGLPLVLRHGKTAETVATLVRQSGADTVLWNRRYEPATSATDAALKQALRADGLTAQSFDGALLHEPSLLLTRSGTGYKVFTPFWKAVNAGPEPRDPIDAPDRVTAHGGKLASQKIDDIDPLPTAPDWAVGFRDVWTPGEDGAHARLAAFLKEDLRGYGRGRDFPGTGATSHLSPHLAHGEITPYLVLAALQRHGGRSGGDDVARFRTEIGWREFCHHLLFHAPKLHTDNVQTSFDAFPWRSDAKGLRAWRRGLTGYPIVDAGMRELWQTGVMHNRVRMIAASFLTKHLLIDWRKGEQWFWDTLVDADPASNPGNWQWVAGCGADAAPYFRIFNPVLQGEKFDPEGIYVRRFVPELDGLPDRYLHKPWEAPDKVLAGAGVTLGENYPQPIVDHAHARERALAAYRSIRGT